MSDYTETKMSMVFLDECFSSPFFFRFFFPLFFVDDITTSAINQVISNKSHPFTFIYFEVYQKLELK